MFEELTQAINVYYAKWHDVVTARTDTAFFEDLRPTAAAWKTFDRADFDESCRQLMDLSDQVHYGWINERWLATFHLKDQSLPHDIRLVKVMQRRPGSSDAVGLDHLDFYAAQDIKKVISKEPELKWTEENNGTHCTWISVWFAGHEAKLRRDTVLKVCADEMLETEQSITG